MKSSKKGTTRVKVKGNYTLNPTKMVMKQSSKEARKAVTSDVPGFKRVKKVKGLNK